MLAQLIITGLTLGSIYALIALGFVLIYKATEVVNFAHGELVMMGAYFAMVFQTHLGLPFPLTFLLTLLAGVLLGAGVELSLRPLINAPLWSLIIATFGMSFILKSVARLLWGPDLYPFPSPFSTTPMTVVGLLIPPQRLWVVGVVLAVMVALYYFFKSTKLGKSMRAVSQNRNAAVLMGINVTWVFALTWSCAAALGAISAILLAPLISIHPEMGLIALKGFTAAIIGGFSSLPGAVLGGLIVGVVETLTSGFIAGGLEEIVALGLLILTLLIRPAGLFAEQTVRRV